jgi:hypothetical protein
MYRGHIFRILQTKSGMPKLVSKTRVTLRGIELRPNLSEELFAAATTNYLSSGCLGRFRHDDDCSSITAGCISLSSVLYLGLADMHVLAAVDISIEGCCPALYKTHGFGYSRYGWTNGPWFLKGTRTNEDHDTGWCWVCRPLPQRDDVSNFPSIVATGKKKKEKQS